MATTAARDDHILRLLGPTTKLARKPKKAPKKKPAARKPPRRASKKRK